MHTLRNNLIRFKSIIYDDSTTRYENKQSETINASSFKAKQRVRKSYYLILAKQQTSRFNGNVPSYSLTLLLLLLLVNRFVSFQIDRSLVYLRTFLRVTQYFVIYRMERNKIRFRKTTKKKSNKQEGNRLRDSICDVHSRHDRFGAPKTIRSGS